MRVLLGLAALAVSVNAVVDVAPNGSTTGASASPPPVGTTALTQIQVRLETAGGTPATVDPIIPTGVMITSLNWVVTTLPTTQALAFLFTTNQYTGQMQYRWSPDYNIVAQGGANSQSYKCDPCSGGGATTCNTATGPGAGNSPPSGFLCSNLSRTYILSGLVQSRPGVQNINSFSVMLFDLQTAPAPNTSSYSFQVIRPPPPIIVGDPQIVGMQGQDFQVHGMPDEIFNIVSSPNVQVNARFTYLESAACHDNYTACFAHPGTYITEQGFRVGNDKMRVTAGSFKKGLTVHVNGKKIASDIELKSGGAVQIVNHRRAIVSTPNVRITITNSDKFMNQEMDMLDTSLIALGSKRTVLKDNQRFHPEVPMHGLQGQTWRNVEYPSGLEYEGSIMDYHVVSGNIYGTDFVFNHFKAQ